MKRKLKNIIVMLFVMAVMLVAAGAVTYAETEGNLSDEVVWTLDDAGTLTIDLAEDVTSAAMPDYHDEAGPFYNMSGIKTVIIKKGITSVGEGSFAGLAEITAVQLPEGLQSIGAGAFYQCSELASINLPEGLQSIGVSAFVATKLRTIVIPDSVTALGEEAFSGCYYAKSLKVSAGMTEIPQGAFAELQRLKSAEIPEGVKKISKNAFADCTELRTITIPKSVETIESQGFFNCLSMETIKFKGDFCLELGVFYLCDFTAYYPLHNATWDEDAVDTGYGGKVKWVGYCNDPKPGKAVKKNVKAATVFKAGSYDSVVYCKVCKKQLSSKKVTIKKLKPTIKLSATKKTLKVGKTYKLKVSKLAKGDAVKSFKTSKKSVATVTSKGVIKAKKKGTATITVTLKSGKTAKCMITVKK